MSDSRLVKGIINSVLSTRLAAWLSG